MEPYKYVSISKWIDSQQKIRATVHFADLGIPVFSCKPDKSPNTPHGFRDATTDRESLERIAKQMVHVSPWAA